MLRLIKPSKKYETSYKRAAEIMSKQDKGFAKNYSPLDIAGQTKKWQKLAQDNVAYRFWLVDGVKYLGTIRLRRQPIGIYPGLKSHIHYSINPVERKKGYGTLILKLGLKKAKILGFKNLIITCKEDNVGSRKIIEVNGGKLLKRVTVQGEREPITILKYKI